jgi:hypothetical protein
VRHEFYKPNMDTSWWKAPTEFNIIHKAVGKYIILPIGSTEPWKGYIPSYHALDAVFINFPLHSKTLLISHGINLMYPTPTSNLLLLNVTNSTNTKILPALG